MPRQTKPDAKEICLAKHKVAQMFREDPVRPCGWGEPNINNPDVVFGGCSACHKAEEAGITIQQAEDDMLQFMLAITGKRDE